MTQLAPSPPYRLPPVRPRSDAHGSSQAAISLGRWFGIRIRADLSVLLLFVLLVVSLATGLFARLRPGESQLLRWQLAFAGATLFFASILLHELSHALVGRAFGIRIRGITLFIFGGVAELEDEAADAFAELMMAAAGPVTSFLIGLGSLALGLLVTGDVLSSFPRSPEAIMRHSNPLAALVFWLGSVNLTLAVFNLLPGFPLDGGRVVRALLWAVTGNLRRATRIATYLGQGVGYSLVGVGVMMTLGLALPVLGTGVAQGMWIALIGWFLANAARISYAQLRIREALLGVPIARLLTSSFQSVMPQMSVSELVEQRVMQSDQRCFPVMSDDRLVGLVCLDDVRKVPREAWAGARVQDIMTGAEQLVMVGPEDDATRALELMTTHEVEQLPVLDGSTLRGFVRRRDLLKWITLQSRAPRGGTER